MSPFLADLRAITEPNVSWTCDALGKDVLRAAAAAASAALMLLQPLLAVAVIDFPLLGVRQHLVCCAWHAKGKSFAVLLDMWRHADARCVAMQRIPASTAACSP